MVNVIYYLYEKHKLSKTLSSSVIVGMGDRNGKTFSGDSLEDETLKRGLWCCSCGNNMKFHIGIDKYNFLFLLLWPIWLIYEGDKYWFMFCSNKIVIIYCDMQQEIFIQSN